MKRRTLLLGACTGAGALLIGWTVLPARSRLGRARARADESWSLNGWVSVYRDGSVGVVVPRAEMGQGVHTALPMLVAEEMELPLARVRIESAPPDPIYGNVAMLLDSLPFRPDAQNTRLARSSQWMVRKVGRELGLQVTGGSTSVRDAWVPMRQAGAVARHLLLAAAARHWHSAIEQCQMSDGAVMHTDGRRLALGDVAPLALREAPPHTIALREPSQFRLLGKSAPRLDVPAKVNGSACFGADVRLPGLLYAAVRMCPTLNGALISVDGATQRTRPGVVRISTFAGAAGAAPGVAVVARDSWTALSAARELDVRWDEGAHAALDSAALLSDMHAQLDQFKGRTFHEEGQGEAALAHAARVIQADYSVPWLAHATMEPMSCTAQFSADGRLHLWAPTQVASIARDVAARVAGISAERVDLTVTLLGGGFGRRLESDFIAVAVQVARDVAPVPVQVLWSRAEDFAHDMYRPAVVARMQAGLGVNNAPQVWVTRSVSDAITPQYTARAYPLLAAAAMPDRTRVDGLFDQPYEFAHGSTQHQMYPTAIPIGYWRAVGHSHNAFFTESFVDEIAHAIGHDPLQLRLDLLKRHPRHQAVLQRAAEQGGWGKPLPAGRARGLALHECFSSIVAQVVEVSLQEGAPRVHRVVCAVDCGVVVNPGIVAQQIEGGILFGLSAALWGEITFKQGRVQQTSFADYPLALLSHSPKIETHIVASMQPPGGVGEISVPPIAPAIANALFALTGQRLRALPLRLNG